VKPATLWWVDGRRYRLLQEEQMFGRNSGDPVEKRFYKIDFGKIASPE